jgi:hypothetical protein
MMYIKICRRTPARFDYWFVRFASKYDYLQLKINLGSNIVMIESVRTEIESPELI